MLSIKNKATQKTYDFFSINDKVISEKIYGSTVNNPIITITIPTFKRAIILEQAIESAINQTNVNGFEVLVVDNNPERGDETEILMRKYIKCGIVSYYKNSVNIGQAGNWNRMCLLAKSNWIVMLHDDDLIYPNALEIGMIYIKNLGDDVALMSTQRRIFYNNIDINKLPVQSEKKSFLRLMRNSYFLRSNYIAPNTLFVRRSSLIDIGGFDQNYYPSNDYECFIRLGQKYKLMILEGIELGLYRVNDSNVSSNINGIHNLLMMDNLIRKKYFLDNRNIIRTKITEKIINVIKKKDLKILISVFNVKDVDITKELIRLDYNKSLFDILVFMLYSKFFSRKVRFDELFYKYINSKVKKYN